MNRREFMRSALYCLVAYGAPKVVFTSSGDDLSGTWEMGDKDTIRFALLWNDEAEWCASYDFKTGKSISIYDMWLDRILNYEMV